MPDDRARLARRTPGGAGLCRVCSTPIATARWPTFNDALAEFQAKWHPYVPAADASRVKVEAFFNSFAPFYHCTMLYVIVFLLAGLSWLMSPAPLARSAFWLGWLTLTVHTAGLIMRMYIQDRPPVTNLYSSAVFIGWGCVLLCLILEAIYRNGIGLFAAGVLGFATSLDRPLLSAPTATRWRCCRRCSTPTSGSPRTSRASPRLHGDTSWRGSWGSSISFVGVFTRPLDQRRDQDAGPDDLRRHLLRDAAELRRARSSAASGPTSRGAASGAGTRRRTAPC